MNSLQGDLLLVAVELLDRAIALSRSETGDPNAYITAAKVIINHLVDSDKA